MMGGLAGMDNRLTNGGESTDSIDAMNLVHGESLTSAAHSSTP